MTSGNLPKHLETIINEACWGVPGVGQLTGEGKLRAILEAANNLSAVMTDPAKLPEAGVPDAAVKEIGSLARQLGEAEAQRDELAALLLSLIHISEPTRPILVSRMPSSA